MKKFAIYVRVSTAKQGRSGLGLEAQQKICHEYIKSQSGEFLKEFKDVESGTHRERPGLLAAIDFCKANDCTLVIAKLDRLARDIEFTFKVLNTGVSIHFCDMPQVNTLVLGMFATVAQYERELTSKRTKDALQAKKAQGFKLGRPKGTDMTKPREASIESRKATARNDSNNKIIWTIISQYIREGGRVPKASDFELISDTLNKMNIRTRTGEEFNVPRARNCYYNMKKYMNL